MPRSFWSNADILCCSMPCGISRTLLDCRTLYIDDGARWGKGDMRWPWSLVAARCDGETVCVGKSETCAVCLEGFEAPRQYALLRCRHGYCLECIKSWAAIGTTCPVCRAPMRRRKRRRPPSDTELFENFITTVMGEASHSMGTPAPRPPRTRVRRESSDSDWR